MYQGSSFPPRRRALSDAIASHYLQPSISKAQITAGVSGIAIAASLATHAATITVNSAGGDVTADTVCTLPEAVLSANQNTALYGCTSGDAAPALDTIEFSQAVRSSTIELLSTLTITEDLAVVPDNSVAPGVGQNGPVVEAPLSSDAFYIEPSVEFSMREMTVRGNPGNGSGTQELIDTNAGTIQLDEMRFEAVEPVLNRGIAATEAVTAVEAENGTVNLSNSSFVGLNPAVYGDESNLDIEASQFYGNVFAGPGGGSDTSGIRVKNSNLRVDNSTFRGLTSSFQNGAAVYAYADREVSLTVIDSNFYDNQAPAGGAISVFAVGGDGSVSANIEDNRFDSNIAVGSAPYSLPGGVSGGGALSINAVGIDYYVAASITDNQFDNNISLEDGGAVAASLVCNGGNGGFIFRGGPGSGFPGCLKYADAIFSRNSVTNNSALGQGGGFAISALGGGAQAQVGEYDLSPARGGRPGGDVFSGNSAASGGGLFVAGQGGVNQINRGGQFANVPVLIGGAVFEGNTATGAGGGLLAQSVVNPDDNFGGPLNVNSDRGGGALDYVPVLAVGNIFSGNQAGSGGGMAIAPSRLTTSGPPSGGPFRYTAAVQSKYNEFFVNRAGHGGAVQIASPLTADEVYGELLFSIGDRMSGNSASYGGGVQVDAGSTFAGIYGVFSDNTASESGGWGHADGGRMFAISTQVFDNQAQGGGAIAAVDSRLEIQRSSLVGNQAATGSALDIRFGQYGSVNQGATGAYLSNSLIANNSIGGYVRGGGGFGSAVFVEQDVFGPAAPAVEIEFATIVDNSSFTGIQTLGGASVNLTNSIVAGHSNDLGGGSSVDASYSLIQSDPIAGPGNLSGDPLLRPVQISGNNSGGAIRGQAMPRPYLGQTLVTVPFADSPVIDAGAGALTGPSAAMANDQRGESRSVGVEVDMGAIEVQGTLTFSTNNATLIETSENTSTVTITRTNTAGDLCVDFDFAGSATLNADFTAMAQTTALGCDKSNQAYFADGVATSDIIIGTIDDPASEADETAVPIFTNAAPVGTWSSEIGDGTVTITDNDPLPLLSLGFDDATISENEGSTALQVTLSAAAYDDVVVNPDFSGSTAEMSDFILPELRVPAGSTSEMFILTAVADEIDESDETVVLAVGSISGPAEADGQQQDQVIIEDDDDQPNITLSLTGSPLAEDGGQATITASLDAATKTPVQIDLAFGGVAQRGDDFAVPTQIMIAPNTLSSSIDLTAIDDNLSEGDESVVINIASSLGANYGSQGPLSAVIIDDEGPSVVSISASATNFAEDGGQVDVTATATPANGSETAVVLDFNGSAVPGLDFQSSSGMTISIPSGQTSASTTLTGLDDDVAEGAETVNVSIAGVVGGPQIGMPNQLGLIIDDDANDVEGIDLAIEVASDADTVFVGAMAQYTVAVTETSGTALNGAIVDVTLPNDFSNVMWTCVAEPGQSCTQQQGVGNISGVAVNFGGAGMPLVTFEITAMLSPMAMGQVTVTGSVAAPTGTSDVDLLNNMDAETDNVMDDVIFSDSFESP